MSAARRSTRSRKSKRVYSLSPVAIGMWVRGRRPDLAGPRLGLVRAPTLLIVGGADDVGLRLNRRARTRLRCPSDLAVVPGAGHLFEEPGALEQVAQLTERWCSANFPPAPAAGG